MQDQPDTSSSKPAPNVLPFPLKIGRSGEQPLVESSKSLTPNADELASEGLKLDRLSKYKSHFDYSVYANIERRFLKKPIHGGIVKSNPMKLVNAHGTCQQCLYAFEIDTYGRGCTHNCTYCYAKAELTVHGYWNNPIPVPVDLNEIRRTFYTVFETEKRNKWRPIMEKKVPLRIGCMSDSFLWTDLKYKVTQELLRILSFYEYPYTIITHSDLVAHDDYLALLRPDLCSVQFSIPSVNDALNRLLEPGAPSAKRRLAAISKLSQHGFWTTARINPMFPIHPDGYFTEPSFKWEGEVPKFDYSSFEMVNDIADAGCSSIIAGFGRFSAFSMNRMSEACGVDLRAFFNREVVNKSKRDYHFSEREIRYYYARLKAVCVSRGIEFTTCYIGNGEKQFWAHQDLWSNKRDCCNIKGKVGSFISDSREVPFEERIKFGGHKQATPIDPQRLHEALGTPSNDERSSVPLKRPGSYPHPPESTQ